VKRTLWILLVALIILVFTPQSAQANNLCDLIDCAAIKERQDAERERRNAPIVVPPDYVVPSPRFDDISAKVNPWYANLERDSGILDRGFCILTSGYGWDGSLAWPVEGGVIKPGRYFRETSNHRGVDIHAPIGTIVKSAENGVVVWAGHNGFGWGNTVITAHGGRTIVYAHLQDVLVECGEHVATGTPIGTIGKSGLAAFPHVHFEVRYGDSMDTPSAVSIDPLRFLRGR
jgi:murein DD-endopeptidase MepM/ murein hydrolase activator NlpD